MVVGAFGLAVQAAWAAASDSERITAGDLFEARRFEASLSSGVLFSPIGTPQSRPVINYTVTSLQFGYTLSEVKGRGWARGNFEVAGEAFGSAIFVGDGNYIAGGTLWLRYNFVPTGGRFIPYVQAGGGAVSTDIDRSIVGQPFNFNLDIGVGLRYAFARDWSVNLEFRYQHISNANTGNKNVGINSYGPILGVSYFF
jgi:opacity protein-like surface antigen